MTWLYLVFSGIFLYIGIEASKNPEKCINMYNKFNNKL
jgi:hypothetical protein